MTLARSMTRHSGRLRTVRLEMMLLHVADELSLAPKPKLVPELRAEAGDPPR